MPNVDEVLRNRPVWFDLSTSDLSASKAFYADLFGWSFMDFGPEMGNYNIASVGDRPSAAVFPKSAEDPSPVAWTVYFGVTSAATTAARIVAAGGGLIVEPMVVGDSGTMVVARDPDGAVFGLWEANTFPGARIEGEHGSMCWSEVNSTHAEQNAAFYSTVFDLAQHKLDTPDHTYFTLHDGEPAVAGVMQMDANWGNVPPHWMPYFAVDNLEAANAVVKKHGGKIMHGPIASPYGSIMVAQDPQGATLSYMAAS